jgi:hypothetical protein
MRFLGVIGSKCIHAVLTVLLMMVAVTPAFAEIGCLEDSFSHLQSAVDHDDAAATSDDIASPENGQSQPRQPMHCAFSHGVHSLAVPAFPAATPDHDDSGSMYPRLAAHVLDSASPDGPYHPPQA